MVFTCYNCSADILGEVVKFDGFRFCSDKCTNSLSPGPDVTVTNGVVDARVHDGEGFPLNGEEFPRTLEDAYDEPAPEKTANGPCMPCPYCRVNVLLHSGEGVHGDLGKYCSEECLQTNPLERTADRNRPVEDVGSHYRKTWKGQELDPYRIADIYRFTGGPREHLLKKVLRGVDKGHTERELVNELGAIVKRWGEMLDEDGE